MPGYGYRGRYGPSSYDEDEKRSFLKVIFSRAWFLIIPLIGLVYANVRQVTPVINEMNKTIAAEKKALETQRANTLTKATPIRSRISALGALGDTFQVRFVAMDTMRTNLQTFLDADQKATSKLVAQRDSLRQVESSASSEAAACAETLRALTPVVDSLTTLIAERTEETQRLWVEIAEDFDLADRVLRPDAYRKKSALVTGEGEYPRRDELPKRGE